MSYRFSGILFFFWVFLIIFCFLVYEKGTNYGDVQALKKEVSKVLQDKNNKNILDKLPSVFDKDLSLLALVLTNKNGYIKGSMFEPERFNSGEYKEFLEKFSEIKKTSQWKTHKLVMFDLKIQNELIYLLISTDKSFTEKFFAAARSIPLLRYLVFSIVLIGAFLLLSVLYNFLWSENRAIVKENPLNKKAKVIQAPNGNQTEFQSSLKYLSEKQLINFIDLMCQKYFCATVAFFSREKSGWLSVLQKRGEIYIKGESIKIPHFLKEFGEPENWNTPVVKESGREYYLPVVHKDILTGVFWCRFNSMNTPEIETIQAMHAMTSAFAKSVFIQKVYEKAVIDEETGFYNYPYFYFLIKERLPFEQNLAALIFQIEPMKEENTDDLKNWGRKLYSIIGKDSSICRLENGKFIAIFNLPPGAVEEDAVENSYYKEIASRVQNSVEGSFSHRHNIYGAIIPREKVKGRAESFLSKAELALKIAAENKVMGYVLSETRGGIV